MKKSTLIILLLIVILVFSTLTASCSLIFPPTDTYEDEEEEETETSQTSKTQKGNARDEKENAPKEVETTKPETEISYDESLSIIVGTYILYGVDGTDEYGEDDINIEIIDEKTGVMYFYAEYGVYNFAYTFIGGILTMNLDNGEVLAYEAMQTEMGDLWLTDVDYPDIRYYYYYDHEAMFSAYGAWVTEYDGTDVASISFWPDGRGYATNWEGADDGLLVVDWEYSYGALLLELHGGEYYYEEFFVEHDGDALEIRTYDDAIVLELSRFDGDMLHGYYFLQDSDAEDFDIEELALYEDGSAMCYINKSGEKSLHEDGWWEVTQSTGELVVSFASRDTLIFDYFYTGYGLLLYDESSGYSYLLSKGLDPSGN